MKYTLTNIFILCVLVSSLHAEQSLIFYGNAKVYGKELLFVKKNALQSVKKIAKIKEETPAQVKHEVIQQEPVSVVFPTLPYEPSSSSFSQGNRESAVVSPQQRVTGDEQTSKTIRENTFPCINDLCLLYYPKQRQKLSISATQCGTLTSFGAQSPPALS